MRIYILSVYLLIAALALCGVVLAEDGILVIHVSDADENPRTGVVLGNKGDGTRSDPTDTAGVTRLDLSKTTRPGDWVHLQVLKGTAGNEEWIMISPWDGRVQVPPFDDKSDRFVSVVVAKRFDKRLLANSKALRAMAESVASELTPKTPGEAITEEQRRAVLEDVAKRYGLGSEECPRSDFFHGILRLGQAHPAEIDSLPLHARLS